MPALVVDLAGCITALGYLLHKFVHADPATRRQIKWVLYGAYVAYIPIFGVEVLVIVFKPALWPVDELVQIFFVLIPLCVFIAIVGFNLYDIDRLIGATAAYTLVSIIVIAGAIVLLPRVAQAANRIVGLDPTTGQFTMSLLLAAVVVPGSRYLRPQIERFFFAERYALERGVEQLLHEISTCASAQEVLTLIGQRLDSYLRPESCVVYGRSGETYAPLFFRGRAVAPTINAGAGLVTALQSETRSVEVERWMRRRAPGLSSSDRAVLDSLGAAVLLPIHRGDLLEAVVCLGQKRSGDIYTATDLTHLTAVGEKVSGELQRFDDAELARQVRAMADSLRRYVPEQIAAQVISGQDLDARESEVSVLFVDIRGYTTYAEDNSAAEVFSTVKRYTETVSRIVRTYGGTVVEFNGDGMMAVFGAPAPLAEKERAAVVSAREIVSSIRSLELGSARREQPALEVGIGIATGNAFVGNIQSVDRLIWSAIGDTTNLAARLQALSRNLNAAIVIDSATRSSIGAAGADFEQHERVPIRGRRQTADVHVLPLVAANSSENLQEWVRI
ncbi:MAG: adenylate/guanylate cyclase domain-containing protein [Deltaproteobacteria bacterium]|nr:adenylate/guanylate cyclase domain-containing protein [Deltaproteobacteria bacterium]